MQRERRAGNSCRSHDWPINTSSMSRGVRFSIRRIANSIADDEKSSRFRRGSQRTDDSLSLSLSQPYFQPLLLSSPSVVSLPFTPHLRGGSRNRFQCELNLALTITFAELNGVRKASSSLRLCRSFPYERARERGGTGASRSRGDARCGTQLVESRCDRVAFPTCKDSS